MAPAVSGFERWSGIFARAFYQMMDTDLIDKFVHGAFPFEQNFVEAPEATGIGHIARVGDCHCNALFSLYLSHRKCIFKLTIFRHFATGDYVLVLL